MNESNKLPLLATLPKEQLDIIALRLQQLMLIEGKSEEHAIKTVYEEAELKRWLNS